MGKIVNLELKNSDHGASKNLPVWFHYECFWGPTYIENPGEKNRFAWSNHDGISALSVEDQEKLHLQIKGEHMPKTLVERAAKDKTFAESAAVYTDSDPKVIIPAMLEKYLNQAKVTDLNLIFSTYNVDKQKVKKKAQMIKIIMDQNLSKIPGVAYSCLDKTMTANDLKTTLKSLDLKTTGTKPKLIWRLLETQDVTEPGAAFVRPSDIEKKQKRKEEKDLREGNFDWNDFRIGYGS